MDSFVVKYLQSGKAWVLVGSGPSIEMGYPSWDRLASLAVELTKIEGGKSDLSVLNKAMEKRDYPRVFEEAIAILGAPRLLQHLRDYHKPTRPGRVYELIAQWPVSVYLTTNYDDELQKNLTQLGLSYLSYSNSEDHLSLLVPGFSGVIIKLHGDLTSETGLILTSQQYRDISEGSSWQYWRTKMTSVFQMNPVVVIGHSLSDENIRHVLEAARIGAGVIQPVCWIAPDVPEKVRREYLEKYRVRVITYDNRDGEHRNLVKLIGNINDFIPPHQVIDIQKQIEGVSHSPLGANAAAPGFFVFKAFCAERNFEEKRIDVVVSAIQSTIPELSKLEAFTLEDALQMVGWPTDTQLAPQFAAQIGDAAIKQGLLVCVGEKFQVGAHAEDKVLQYRTNFEHMRDRFKKSLLLRIKRDYPDIGEQEATLISSDIESALTGYFREGGLTLASILFARERRSSLPNSVIPFIASASARYADSLMRQAFFTASTDVFVRPESADRDYLGRISQGFFAFHVLGTFGDAAIERLRHAKDTVWLIDSDTQIRALAIAAPACATYRECFSRLRELGLRFFTTTSLFDETLVHLWFANKVITDNGVGSPFVIAAAKGETPFRKQNLFLEGFIKWQAAGNPHNWQNYLYQMFEHRSFSAEPIKNALNKIGIEVIPLEDWPGFSQLHHSDVAAYTDMIARICEQTQHPIVSDIEETEELVDPYRKALPEAEALNIVNKEREGTYYMLSDEKKHSDAWFLSYTSILNLLADAGPRFTWQPEAFLSFASTLCSIPDSQSADHAFEMLLIGVAQSGLNLLSDELVERVFGTTIDETKLDIEHLHKAYSDTLEQKYGETLESVLARVPSPYRQMASIQLASEMTEASTRQRDAALKAAIVARQRAEVAEKELGKVEKFRRRMEERKRRAKVGAKKRKVSTKKKRKTRK